MDKKLQRDKEALVREYFEIKDIAGLLDKKLKHLKRKKFGNKQVIAILERDLARLKGKKAGCKGRVAHLTCLQVHSGRRK